MALPKNPKFDLKLHYKRILEGGFALSLILLIAAFKFFPKFEISHNTTILPQDRITVLDAISTRQDSKPPVPPKPVLPEITTVDGFEEELVLTDIDFKNPVSPMTPLPPKNEVINEPVPDFIPVAEVMPEPVGGIAEIQNKIKYPPIAIKANIEGRVIVKAFVDEKGNVIKTELLKGIGGGCDEEAMLAVQQTKFSPGKQRGKPVRVQVAVPVVFKLR